LAENTGQPLSKIELDTERDYYLSATESKEYGLIDEVISKRALVWPGQPAPLPTAFTLKG
jgi:ATP-dependent Clp protease protease subunit